MATDHAVTIIKSDDIGQTVMLRFSEDAAELMREALEAANRMDPVIRDVPEDRLRYLQNIFAARTTEVREFTFEEAGDLFGIVSALANSSPWQGTHGGTPSPWHSASPDMKARLRPLAEQWRQIMDTLNG